MKEYIVKIEDDEMDYEEYFVGYIRKQQKELTRCKDCKLNGLCVLSHTEFVGEGYCAWAEPKDTTEEVRKQLKDMEQRREMDRKK